MARSAICLFARGLSLAIMIACGPSMPASAQSPGGGDDVPPPDSTAIELPDTLAAPVAAVASSQVTSFAGEQSTYRPYRQEPSVFLSAPANRYNRVEGAVVGLQKDPLSWTGTPRVAPFGQVSYSFGLRDWRAVVGVEARIVTPPKARRGYGLKVGAHAARTTATEDDWKRSWEENSVSALLFGQDLFNYYDLRGVTVYAVQRFSTQLRVTAGARWAEHDDLPQTTSWALLDRSRLRSNPPVDAGDVRTGLLTIEGGHLTRWSEARSVGTIARVHAEIGMGLGAALDYNRFILDVRTYQAATPSFNVNLRGRVGVTTEDAPVQLQFHPDGVRGLRTFDPSARATERMLLGGVEGVWHDVPHTEWAGRSQLKAFGDLGWYGDKPPPQGETFAFAGLGASAFGGVLSLEFAWPLHETPTRLHSHWRPQVTIKVNPLR